MKILLVFPSKPDDKGNIIKYKKALFAPLNLAILDSLTPSCHKVTVVNDIAETIDFLAPYDLVGITAMTPQVERAYQIADRFRASGVKVVMGGFHPTFLPHEAKEHSDAVVIGEAEDLWEELLDDCENNRLKDFYKAPSVCDLKRLVIPKWDNFNLNKYTASIGSKLPELPMFATRGCPFRCNFCSITHFFNGSFKAKPVENVLKEIDASMVNRFFIVDDNIIGKPDYARELFKALTPKNIRWLAQFSTGILRDPELIDLAAGAGCHSAFLGIESINRESLQGANKGFNKISQYEEIFKRLKKAKITPYVSIIFGFEQDTLEVFKETLDFLFKNNISVATFQILTPFPGTKSFEDIDGDDRILHKNWSLYDGNHLVFKHKILSNDQLVKGYWGVFREFYSIGNIIKKLFNPVRFTTNQALNTIINFSYFLHNRKIVHSCEHPLSGGVNKIR